jgi:hypothetical protein
MPSDRNEYAKQWRKDHAEHIQQKNTAWRVANPNYNRDYNMFRQYGLTKEDYDELLISQDYRCNICGKTIEEARQRRPLSVDHNHDTGQVRGLLCRNCNSCLGWYERFILEILDHLDILDA